MNYDTDIFSARTTPSDHVVPSSHRCAGVAVGSSDGSFLEQSHKLPHGVRDREFCFAFNKNVQLGVLAGTRLLASRVETALGGDGRSGSFEDLGHVRTVGNGPPSFLCFGNVISICSRQGQKVEGEFKGKQRTGKVVDLQCGVERPGIRAAVVNGYS